MVANRFIERRKQPAVRWRQHDQMTTVAEPGGGATKFQRVIRNVLKDVNVKNGVKLFPGIETLDGPEPRFGPGPFARGTSLTGRTNRASKLFEQPRIGFEANPAAHGRGTRAQ